jgi:hypothetical protein
MPWPLVRTSGMRWLVLALVVSAALVGVVVMAAVRSGDEGSFYGFKEHAPESDDEKRAAGVAVAYFRGLLHARPDQVCRTVTEPLATSMQCATKPRIPRKLRVYADGRLRVTHISLNGAEGDAWISGISPGPAQNVSLRRVGRVWRVAGNHAFGLA